MPNCFVVGCSNNTKTRTGLSYHSFPKNLDSRRQWLKLIGRDPNLLIIYERVCSEHFCENNIKLIGSRTYLDENAVPVKYLPAPFKHEDNMDIDHTPKPFFFKLNMPPNIQEIVENEKELQSKKMKLMIENVNKKLPTPVLSTSLTNVEPVAGCSGIQRPTSFIDIGSSPGSMKSTSSSDKRRLIKFFHNYNLSPDHYRKEILMHTKKIKALKTKLDSVKRTTKYRKRKVSNLKQIVHKIKNEKLVSANVITVLEATFSGVPLELMRRIVFNNKSSSQSKNCRKKYPNELKQFAMTLNFYSPKAYNYVRRTFDLALPAPSTMRSWMLKIDCTPGFTQQALESLKTHASEYREKSGGRQLLGCLIFDEMAIKAEIVCEKHSGKLWGYIDVGTNIQSTNDNDVAKNALVFMVVGINDSFKLPIAYFFINSLTGEERANLVLEVLKQLAVVDMKILSITCDGPQVHHKMMKDLGCEIHDVDNLKPYFLHPITNERTFVIFDICHMLKLIRNNWASSKVFIDIDGNEIKWDYIEALHRIQKEEGIYFANKLREKHIIWKKYIMKVNIAAQTLSLSVADTLEFLWKDCQLKEFEHVMPTVNFIRKMNNLFDLLNSRNPLGKKMKTPLRKANENYWKPFLLETATFIKSLKLQDGTFLYKSSKRVPFIGFVVAIQSFLCMYDIEVCQNDSLAYILTYKFSQDHLELLFCSIRSANGSNNNPNCLQFFYTYRKLLAHIDIQSNTGNCLIRDNTKMLKLCDKQITDIFWERQREQEIQLLQEKIDIILPKNLSYLQENAISYVAGFVVKSLLRNISCVACMESLSQAFDEYDTTLKLIQRRSKGGLLYPSRSVRYICNKIEGLIKLTLEINGYLPKKDILVEYLLRNTRYFLENGHIFPNLHDHILEQTPYEVSHKEKLIKEIIKKYSIIRIHSLAQKINENISGEKVRKELSKLILFKHQ